MMLIDFPSMYCNEIKVCAEFVRLIIDGFKHNENISTNEFAKIFDAWYKTNSKSIPEIDLHYLKIYEVGLNICGTPIHNRYRQNNYRPYFEQFQTQIHKYILQSSDTICFREWKCI